MKDAWTELWPVPRDPFRSALLSRAQRSALLSRVMDWIKTTNLVHEVEFGKECPDYKLGLVLVTLAESQKLNKVCSLAAAALRRLSWPETHAEAQRMTETLKIVGHALTLHSPPGGFRGMMCGTMEVFCALWLRWSFLCPEQDVDMTCAAVRLAMKPHVHGIGTLAILDRLLVVEEGIQPPSRVRSTYGDAGTWFFQPFHKQGGFCAVFQRMCQLFNELLTRPRGTLEVDLQLQGLRWLRLYTRRLLELMPPRNDYAREELSHVQSFVTLWLGRFHHPGTSVSLTAPWMPVLHASNIIVDLMLAVGTCMASWPNREHVSFWPQGLFLLQEDSLGVGSCPPRPVRSPPTVPEWKARLGKVLAQFVLTPNAPHPSHVSEVRRCADFLAFHFDAEDVQVVATYLGGADEFQGLPPNFAEALKLSHNWSVCRHAWATTVVRAVTRRKLIHV